MSPSSLQRRLSRRGLFRIKPGLERVQAVLKVLGNPENKPRSIHIAGTNGKGSVAAGFESVLRQAGYRTGLYTSPHLIDVRERVQIDRQPISSAQFEAAAEKILAAEKIARCRLTYFEFLTVIAFEVFADEDVDVAVIETGMGGRWDATNVLSCPSLTVVTSIGLDHVRWLGRTESAIAREKAGILKAGVPMISGVRGKPADVIARAAQKQGSPLLRIDHDFSAKTLSTEWKQSRQTIRYAGRLGKPETYTLGLLGTHQTDNAAVVLTGLQVLQKNGWALEPSAIREGLAGVRWAGRFQLLQGLASCPVLFDGAHNPSGVKRLLDTLNASPWRDAPKTFLFGVYRDKDHAGMMRLMKKSADQVVLCTLPGARALPAKKLSRSAKGVPIRVVPDPRKALQTAFKATRTDGLVVVCGSITLVGILLQNTGSRELCLN